MGEVDAAFDMMRKRMQTYMRSVDEWYYTDTRINRMEREIVQLKVKNIRLGVELHQFANQNLNQCQLNFKKSP